MKTLLCSLSGLVLVLGPAATTADDDVRTWTSSGGQAIKASLVDISANGETLELVNEDGKKFLIPAAKLCADDQEYVRLIRFERTGGPVVVYEGESIAFCVDRNAVLYLQGTGTKKTWPKGRPPKPKRSRHTGKLMPVKIAPGKGPVTVDEEVSWTNTTPADFIAMLEKVVRRAEAAIDAKSLVKRYSICGGLELYGDRLGGVTIWFECDAALMDLPKKKREMRYKQGNLASATLTINTHDGKDSSDLAELSETFNETQLKALLQALRNVPFDKLDRP